MQGARGSFQVAFGQERKAVSRRVPSHIGYPAVTDADLVRKPLAFIETCVGELADLPDPVLVDHDVRERRMFEQTPESQQPTCEDERWIDSRRMLL